MLNVRDTIIAGKRRCLYLAAALAIVEEQQKRLEEAEEQERQPHPEERHKGKWLKKVPSASSYPRCVKAIITVYKDEVLHCPKTEEEWKEVAATFSTRWNYHNCLGAVDGKHMAMKKPPNAGSYYYNYKGFHSIVLMAVADATYKFLYVNVGAEGGASDGGTWSNCSLHDAVEENRAGVPQSEPLPNDDQPVPYHFVGDDAFALRTWMMKPFSGMASSVQEALHQLEPLSHTIECGDDAYLRPGDNITLISPGYPVQQYPRQYDCLSIIETTLGSTIRVHFNFFKTEFIFDYVTLDPSSEWDIEDDDNDDKFDYSGFHSGSGSGSGDGEEEYSGIENFHYSGLAFLGEVLYFQTDSLAIRFHSDMITQDEGFEFKISALGNTDSSPQDTIACGEDATLAVGDEVFITSPNYPGFHPSMTDCKTRISSETGAKLFIESIEVNLECCCDTLTVNQHTQLNCGDTWRLEIPDGNVLTLTFRSDSLISGRGFKLRVTSALNLSADMTCGESRSLATGESATIVSPNYPGNYPADTDCNSIITTEEGASIYFQVIRLNMETCCDHLYVNGDIVTEPSIEEMMLNRHSLTIHFTSDSSFQYSGFKISVRAEKTPTTNIYCGDDAWVEPGNSISIVSPNYPEPYLAFTNCTTTISAPPDTLISASFVNNSIECCCDRVSINDEIVQCGDVETLFNSHQLVVNFGSDGSVQLTGFQLQVNGYEAALNLSTDIACGESRSLATGESATIVSPNYPGDYPADTDCNSIITTEEGASIYFQVLRLNMETCCDHLYVNGDVVLEPTIGEMMLNRHSLTIDFTSDSSFQYSGFKMSVRAGPTKVTSLQTALEQFGLTICRHSNIIGLKCIEDCITADKICDGHQDCSWTEHFYFDDEGFDFCDETSTNIHKKRSIVVADGKGEGEDILWNVVSYLRNQ
ncbi:cubilin-like [Saccoglossus kowalevskii]|uniref:Cubilin-like n=1 Tax=Saccoglossus kowalevskii TaxID=10224 RepID=A0ABM0GVB6_SACKO|nr:PREDICTED: cubilin-like [Saccoglossus kowalevskii]